MTDREVIEELLRLAGSTRTMKKRVIGQRIQGLVNEPFVETDEGCTNKLNELRNRMNELNYACTYKHTARILLVEGMLQEE